MVLTVPDCQPTLFPAALSRLVENAKQQTPLVIQEAFPASFLTEQDAFNAWRTFTKGIPPARWGQLVRFYRGSELITDVEPFLPTQSDTSWDCYLKRLDDRTGSSNWGLCLSDPQLSSPKIFRRLLAFLSTLYEHTGMPRGGCIPDLFMMNHEASFFRLHKDAQDVFTFVISGRRRFLLWPFETFSDLAGMTPYESRKPHRLVDVDHEDYRSQATVIEGTAGDLLYWPAEWWHVGESDGERAVTLAVGTLPEGNPLPALSAAANRLGNRRRDRLEPLRWSASEGAGTTIAARIDWMNSLLADEHLWAEARRGLRSWTTRCGLSRVPPPLRRKAALDDESWIAVTSPAVMAFDAEGGASLSCSIAGHDLTLTPGEPAKFLLSRLSGGGVYRVGAVLDEVVKACGPNCDREQARRLLEKIEENYGFERLDDAPRADARDSSSDTQQRTRSIATSIRDA